MATPDAVLEERARRDERRRPSVVPGRVVTFDRKTRLASIQPLIRVRSYGIDDVATDSSRSVVDHVPVRFISDGTISLTWTVNPGALGMLVPTGEPLDDWLDQGQEVGPYEGEPLNRSDCFFLPGVLDAQTASQDEPPPENGIKLCIRNPVGPDTFKIELDLATMQMQFSAPAGFLFGGSKAEFQVEDFVVVKPDGSNPLRLDMDGRFRP